MSEGWFSETLHPTFRQSLRIDRTVHREHTGFQDLTIFESGPFGRVLTLDGVVQTTEADEFIYHEMLVHVPAIAHGRPRQVLIIGGGDGGTLREVLKHPIDRAVMVELDPRVVELSRAHLPAICGDAFDDPRSELLFADGIKYVADCTDLFDLIIIDSTDPSGPGEVLFGTPFYTNCKRILAPGGIFVAQNGVPFLQDAELRRTAQRLTPLFADVSAYLVPVPTYVGGQMALAWATDEPGHRTLPLDTLSERILSAGLHGRFYSAETHQAAFALPPYIEDLLS